MFHWKNILMVVFFVWAVIVTALLVVDNPLPVPDKGHRLFTVSSEQAVKAVLEITKASGLGERFTFDPLPTHQTLLTDNTTVIAWHDNVPEGLENNAISLVSSNPVASAMEAVEVLTKAGFQASVVRDIVPEMGDKICAVTSDAFDGWMLVFRLHVLKLGNPPGKRKISE